METDASTLITIDELESLNKRKSMTIHIQLWVSENKLLDELKQLS